MSTDDEDPRPSIDDLVAELHDTRRSSVDEIDDAPGNAIYLPSDVVRMFALSTVATSDPPGPHGNALLDAIQAATGSSPSPGSVYPLLHDFEAEGVFARLELVGKKHYTIADAEAADERLANYERRLGWWLELCRTAREALDVDDEH